MAKVLIAGCGYVGEALGLRLLGAGHDVWGLRRRPGSLPHGLQPLPADLTSPETLNDLPTSLDVVFYTAAATGRSEDEYRSAYVQGLENLLRALVDQGQTPRRIFFTSSTGVYAQSAGEWVDEDSPTEPTAYSGRLVLQGEELLGRSPLPATALRLGGIYGPGRTRLLDSVRHGTALIYEGPGVYSNRIHRDDCAGALHHLMELTDPEPIYVGVDSEPTDRSQVLAWLGDRIGVSLPREATPPPEARGRGKRCRNARLLASGYVFRYPTFREGYGEMVDARG